MSRKAVSESAECLCSSSGGYSRGEREFEVGDRLDSGRRRVGENDWLKVKLGHVNVDHRVRPAEMCRSDLVHIEAS